MHILLALLIVITIYSVWVARNANLRLNLQPRSLHLSVSKKDSYDRVEFYVLLLGRYRVLFDPLNHEEIDVGNKIDACVDLDGKEKITCRSWGDSLKFQYITDPDAELAEQGDELSLSVLTLPQTAKNRIILEQYLHDSGWKHKLGNRASGVMKNALLIEKGNLDVSLSYIT